MLIEHGAYEEMNKKEDKVLRTFNEIGMPNTARDKKSVNLKQPPVTESLSARLQENYVKDRLAKLTNSLRDKFQNSWVSVRKAFLDLDVDKDGEISPEDIMRYFGDAGNHLFDFFDLVKVIHDLDGRGKGTLSYNDFC